MAGGAAAKAAEGQAVRKKGAKRNRELESLLPKAAKHRGPRKPRKNRGEIWFCVGCSQFDEGAVVVKKNLENEHDGYCIDCKTHLHVQIIGMND